MKQKTSVKFLPMSLSRNGEDGEWYDVNPGYLYVRSGKWSEYEFNAAIRSVPYLCEFAMRALDQSGELDDETLEACDEALRSRFDYVFDGGKNNDE